MAPIVKPRTYVLVFIALLALTAATIRLAQRDVDLGEWHTAVGLAIAAAKGLLIVVFFMHVLRSTRLIWLMALSGLFWLAILMVLTLMDFMTRSLLAY